MSTICKEFSWDIIKGHGYGVAPSAVETMSHMVPAATDSESGCLPLDYLQESKKCRS